MVFKGMSVLTKNNFSIANLNRRTPGFF